MKILIILCILLPILGALAGPLDMSEEEFEQRFHDLTNDDEIEEEESEALDENEEEIDEINEEYEEGKVHFKDGLNSFSNLGPEEFKKEKMGLIVEEETAERAMGLIMPDNIEDQYDEESERIIDDLVRKSSSTSRAASYDSVARGLLTPVKNQQQCGSCAAFASTAVIETCMIKAGGHRTDLSEQAMVDCGYNGKSMNACHGAWPSAYIEWMANFGGQLPHEQKFPYLNDKPTLQCKAKSNDFFHTGAKVIKRVGTYSCSEDKLKAMVLEYGAVLVAIHASAPGFKNYKSGVFDACSAGDKMNHAVVVVGFGEENGIKYWKVRNSWGKTWGDHGYFKMKRGVNMCQIEAVCYAAQCARNGRSDPEPPAPPKPETCDLSELYGPNLNGLYNLKTNMNGQTYNVQVTCEKSLCSLRAGSGEPCPVICGKPCCKRKCYY